MIRRDTFIPIHNRAEPIGQVHQFPLHRLLGRDAGKSRHVLHTSRRPVVDDVQRQQTRTNGVEPPDIKLTANEREEQRKGVEDDIGLAIWRIDSRQ